MNYTSGNPNNLWLSRLHNTDQPLSGQDSVIYLHLEASSYYFNDEDVQILDREERWFVREVKEVIYMKTIIAEPRRGPENTSYNALIAVNPPNLCE